jgi:tripartite-type tricarboxylate transporter receptor subunit TctC
LNGHVGTMLDDPANRKRFDDSFYEPMRMSPVEFAARVKADVAKWERIVQQTGVQAE